MPARFLFTLIAGFAAMTGFTQETETVNELTFHTFTVSFDGNDQPCVVYVPRGYLPEKKWPLVVALHGMGERGSDGEKHLSVGIGTAIKNNPERFPALVLMPQRPDDSFWVALDSPIAKGLKDASPLIDIALEETKKHFNVDPNRITLTGLSMGGYATWIYGAQRTDVYAAFLPICGGGNTEDAALLAKRPIRAFHGSKDKAVPPSRSRKMVEAVEKAGGNVVYTEFEGIDHNSWDATYSDAAVISWLLAQSLPEPPAAN